MFMQLHLQSSSSSLEAYCNRNALSDIAAIISYLADKAAQHIMDHDVRSVSSHHPSAVNPSIPRPKAPLVRQLTIYLQIWAYNPKSKHCFWSNQALSVVTNTQKRLPKTLKSTGLRKNGSHNFTTESLLSLLVAKVYLSRVSVDNQIPYAFCLLQEIRLTYRNIVGLHVYRSVMSRRVYAINLGRLNNKQRQTLGLGLCFTLLTSKNGTRGVSALNL